MLGIIKVEEYENQYGIKIMTFQPGIFNRGLGIDVEKELGNLVEEELGNLVEEELQKLKDKLKPNEHTAKNSTTEEDSVFCFNTIEKIELICNKFHQVARQMRSRHTNKVVGFIKAIATKEDKISNGRSQHRNKTTEFIKAIAFFIKIYFFWLQTI